MVKLKVMVPSDLEMGGGLWLTGSVALEERDGAVVGWVTRVGVVDVATSATRRGVGEDDGDMLVGGSVPGAGDGDRSPLGSRVGEGSGDAAGTGWMVRDGDGDADRSTTGCGVAVGEGGVPVTPSTSVWVFSPISPTTRR
jgi:hypothetical protein